MQTTMRNAARRVQSSEVEGRFQITLVAAMTEANDFAKRYNLEFKLAPSHPKRTAEFTIIHLTDNHPVGFVRAVAYIPVTSADPKTKILRQTGFMASIQFHLDEDDKMLRLKVNSLLDTHDKRDALKAQIMVWVEDRIKRWAK